MANKGWIQLHRQLADHWLWERKPFSEGQAWIDLLLLAYHEDVQKPYKGTMKTYHRGDVNVSLSFLANRWGWSRKRVTRFIKLLENAEMVTTRVTTNDTTITLVNYSNFQVQGTTRVAAIGSSEGNNEGSSEGNTINNYNNYNNVNNTRARKKSYAERMNDAWARLEEKIAREEEEDDDQ